jgi:outer membrane protein OmpA-like peptidoglycan-associated protein
MKFLNQAGRLLALLLLLVIGIGLIWHIGHNLFPVKQRGVSLPAPHTPAAALPVTASPAPPPTPSGAVSMDGDHFVTTERGQFISTDPILFNEGAATLREASIPKLDKVAKLLKEKPDIELEIIGHTDNLGIEPVNQKVSAERAATVMDYLVAQGIDRSRLKSKGMGSLDPITSNDTQLGRQANRRIEFLVIRQESKK